MQRKNWLPLVFGPETSMHQRRNKDFVYSSIVNFYELLHAKLISDSPLPKYHSMPLVRYPYPQKATLQLRACIGHRQNSGARVFKVEVLILKLLAIDGLAPRSIA